MISTRSSLNVILHRIGTSALAKALARPVYNNVARAKIEDVSAIDADLDALAEDFGIGRIARREWLAAREQLDARKTKALAAFEPEPVDVRDLNRVREATDVTRAWAALTAEKKRQVLRLLIARLDVGPVIHQRSRRFDPDRVDIVWRRLTDNAP